MSSDTSNRRITRSFSNEIQARTAAQSQSQTPAHNPPSQHYSNGMSGLIDEVEAPGKDSQRFFRNSSDEALIKSLVEGSMAGLPPNMEGIGFTNLPQTLRGDSEELFHSWMSNAEGQGSGQSQAPRNRQSARRMSNELSALWSQQTTQTLNRVNSFDQFLQTSLFLSDNGAAEDSNQPKHRNLEAEKDESTDELSPLKSLPWLSQSTPMTRSRSSELRRRYAAMQGRPLPPTQHIHEVKPGSVPVEDGIIGLGEKRLNQTPYFSQLNQATPPPFQAPALGTYVSNVVSMLKGTLERKKLGTYNSQQQQQLQQHQQVLESCVPSWRTPEELQNRTTNSNYQVSNSLKLEGIEHQEHESYGQVQTTSQTYIEGQEQADGQTNMGHYQPGLLSHVPSPSESSGGAPVISAGEDPCNSGQATSTGDFSLKRSVQQNPDGDNQPKRQNSVGSYSSSGLRGTGFVTEKEDPTKRRRVERQRKLAEAKGRISVPMMPSDLQAALKRCDALEKEVRSLKLNLGFMNRKDSEQTKQIEELQKQNEDLQQEKQRLLEDIDRLASGTNQS